MISDRKKIGVKLTIEGDPDQIRKLAMDDIVKDLQEIEKPCHGGVEAVSKTLYGVVFTLTRIWEGEK